MHARFEALRIPKMLFADLAIHPDDAGVGLAGSGLMIVNPPYGADEYLQRAYAAIHAALADSGGGLRGSRAPDAPNEWHNEHSIFRGLEPWIPNVLRDQLAKLHEELGNVRRVDPRSNAPVGRGACRTSSGSWSSSDALDTPARRPADASLPERLEKVAVQFEADHPTLAASSRRLIDLLGKVGL